MRRTRSVHRSRDDSYGAGSSTRQAELLKATNLLLDARRTSRPIAELPTSLQPQTLDEAFWVQAQMIEAYGQVGGWKVGAPTADATPIAAPMPRAWMGPNGSCLAEGSHRFRGLEAEVAFFLGSDLPPRATPYTDDEVRAAIASCHPAIEVLESGLLDPTDPEVHRLSQIADLQMHGGFVYGPAYPGWETIDFNQEHVTLAVDASIRVERTGSNTSGNLHRLLPWLANEGAVRTGGLFAGQWITTGSWTGVTLATAASAVDAHFSTLGTVTLAFA